jgi:excisionase family DNA binding protein
MISVVGNPHVQAPGAILRDVKDRILNVEEAAEILDLHPSRVRVFCEAGRLPARKIGKGWALLLSDVQAFKRQERKTGRPPRWPMASPHRPQS